MSLERVLLSFFLAAVMLAGIKLASFNLRSPEHAADQWAQAVVAEDYVTARDLSVDDPHLFHLWESTTRNEHQYGHLQTFTITETGRSGSTVHFCVEFGGTDTRRPTHYTNIYSDGQGGISAGYGYTPGRCP